MSELFQKRGCKSLFEKTQGPNAVAIDTLIERGNTAALLARADYSNHLQERVPVIEALSKTLFSGPNEPEKWQSYYTIVRDLRSSSASADYKTVSAICHSLEVMLIEHNRADHRTQTVIALHLDALKLATANGLSEGAAASSLIESLECAVDKLDPI